MGEKRAVQVSHELWRQIMTQGHTSAGARCVEGIPEDAQEVGAFANGNFFVQHNYTMSYIDPVFVFESESWETAASEQVIQTPWGIVPLLTVKFQAAECRTCKWWDRNRHRGSDQWHDCALAIKRDYLPPLFAESKAKVVVDRPVGDLKTRRDFACTQYEPRETND